MTGTIPARSVHPQRCPQPLTPAPAQRLRFLRAQRDLYWRRTQLSATRADWARWQQALADYERACWLLWRETRRQEGEP